MIKLNSQKWHSIEKNKRILIPIDLLHISCKLVLFENKLQKFVKTTFIIFMKILITVNFKQKK